MAGKHSRKNQNEDAELLKLVGAVLENTTRKPRKRRRLWVEGRRLRTAKTRLLRLLRKHPLVPASVALFGVVWLCVVNVTSRSSEAAVAPVSSDGPSPGVARFEPPSIEGSHQGASQGVTQSDARRLKPLSYWFDLLKSPDWKTRSDASFELVQKSRSSKVVLTSLLVLLDDPHAGVRFWAVDRFRVLGMYREKVKSSMRGFIGESELVELYKQSSGRMRSAFEGILRSWLADLDLDVRWTGLVVCGMLGPRATVFRPTLEVIEKSDPSEQYRRQARVLLKNLSRGTELRELGRKAAGSRG